MLTNKQRAQVSRLRYQCYKEEKIAEMMAIEISDVRSVSRRGRPAMDLTDGPTIARLALKTALKKTAVSERFLGVKCVLANFGDVLGLEVGDANRVIEDYLAGKVA